MPNSTVTYTGNGTTQTFAVPFPYISQSEVSCTVSGVPVTFTWPTSSSITLSITPANNATVYIFRTTNENAANVVFADGTTIRASDLNFSVQQLLYGIQDVEDQALAAVQKALTGTGQLPAVTSANNGQVLLVAGGVWSVGALNTAGLGTAALANIGTAAGQVPTNSLLGAAAFVSLGVAPTQVPLNSSLGSAAYLPLTTFTRTLFSNAGPSGTLSNIAGQTAFGISFSLPANTLGAGKVLRIKVGGFVTANAAQSVAVFITCGGISFQSPNFAFAASGSGAFWGEMILNCRAAGASVNCGVIGALNVTNTSAGTSEGTAEGGLDATGFNTTIANTISASFASSVGNNSSGLNSLIVEILN